MHSNVKFYSRMSVLSFQIKLLTNIRRKKKILKNDFVAHQKMSKRFHGPAINVQTILRSMQNSCHAHPLTSPTYLMYTGFVDFYMSHFLMFFYFIILQRI